MGAVLRVCSVGVLLWATSTLLPATARAEEEPDEPGQPRSVNQVATSTGSQSRAERAEVMFRQAFQALAIGAPDVARALLLQAARDFPEHALTAAEMLELLGAERQASAGKEKLRLGRDSEPSTLPRAELIVLQTLHGIAVGGELCATAACDDARAIGASLVLGGAVGFGLSYFLTSDGITPGHTASLNNGTLWGLWNAVAILNVVQPTRNEDQVIPGSLVIGQLAGLGLGELAWRYTHASAGDVSLASSVGIWSGVLTVLIHGANEFEAEDEVIWGTLLAASDIGLLGGVLVADLFPMSRGHALVIDGGGTVGLLLGMGIDLLIQGRDVEAAPLFTLASVGAVAGLGLTAYLTKDWEVEEPPVSAMILPTEGGALFTLGGTL